MKFLVLFALALASTVSGEILFHRDLNVPVIETEGRITNGQRASVGQFPYQVGLSLKVSALSSAWCGGSLIANNWVLTAAHCTDGIQGVTVYLGATVRTNAAATRKASAIIIHPGWNSKTLLNDISLLRIDSAAGVKNTEIVRLPSLSSAYATYVGQNAIASGWGRTSDSASGVATDLMWARMQIVANSVCSNTYGSSVVAASNVCVATPNRVSTCNGDSGGPLVLESPKVQVGLTSYGAAAGCEKGYPVAFTAVTSYLYWIRDYTGVAY